MDTKVQMQHLPHDTIVTEKCGFVACFTSGTNNKDGCEYLGAKCIWLEKIMKACVHHTSTQVCLQTPEMPPGTNTGTSS